MGLSSNRSHSKHTPSTVYKDILCLWNTSIFRCEMTSSIGEFKVLYLLTIELVDHHQTLAKRR